MLEVIERLANEPAAMKLARFAAQTGSSVPLAQVKMLAPLLDPPAIWAAARTTRRTRRKCGKKWLV